MRAQKSKLVFGVSLLLLINITGCRLPKLFLTPPENTLY